MTKQIHFIRPSQMQQAWECPGSVKMQMGFPYETSPEAEEGTMLHAKVARGETDGLDVEQAGAVEACLDFLHRTVAESGLTDVAYENPLEIRSANGDLLTKGTADCLLSGRADAGECAVIDWKFGRVAVPEAAGNLQLATYALGAMQLLKVRKCTVHVFQPRIAHHTSYTFTNPEAILANLERCTKRALEGEALILRAGEACRYCKAKGVCPAFQKTADELAVVHEGLAILANPDTLADFYAKSQILKKFIGQIEDAMKAYLDEHGECCGYEYKEIAGKREVSDIAGLCVALDAVITRSEFLDCCTASTSKLEALFIDRCVAQAAAKGEKCTKKAAKEAFEALSANFIQRGKGTRRIERTANQIEQ